MDNWHTRSTFEKGFPAIDSMAASPEEPQAVHQSGMGNIKPSKTNNGNVGMGEGK